MKLDEVPQHDSSSYGGHKKLLYVTTDDGRYTPSQSSGWDTEAYATQLAVQTLQQQAEQAYQQWQQGLLPPLPFLMYQARLDETGLSQISGFWRWRIRRPVRGRDRPSPARTHQLGTAAQAGLRHRHAALPELRRR